MDFLSAHFWDFVIGFAIAAWCIWAVRALRKNGHSCGCASCSGCSTCGSATQCHPDAMHSTMKKS